jgi:hypothetical protein
MKNLLLSIIVLLSFQLFSQTTEGFFQFSIEVKALDTSLAVRQNVAALTDSRMDIYFADKLSRVDFKMGRIYLTSVRINRITQKAVSLTTSSMAGNFATILPIDQMDANMLEKDTNILVNITGEEKVILGFNCKKAILNNNGQLTTYWYTNDLTIDVKGHTILNPNIPGFPLAFSSSENGMFMSFQASNYQLSLDDKEALFSTVIPEGFTITPQQPMSQPQPSYGPQPEQSTGH